MNKTVQGFMLMVFAVLAVLFIPMGALIFYIFLTHFILVVSIFLTVWSFAKEKHRFSPLKKVLIQATIILLVMCVVGMFISQ
ncbi:MAG: hypothetical protein GY750_00570 [Lentisphaerae bacterium]|nr:hypothetical protein [Lentisphaerota bacterium]MCP4099913.1 hypothetical protein [Lentisphaerota bacterium]